MRRYWRAYLRFGIGGWLVQWLALLLFVVTGYTNGYGLVYWAVVYWPLILVLWLLVLLAVTVARATRAVLSTKSI